MTCACSIVSWMMLTTLHFNISIAFISFDAPFAKSLTRIASYRIANREPGRHTRGARGAVRGAASGSARSRRGGRWRTSGVPRSPPELLRERQAPEHFLPGLQLLIKCFTLIDALGSGVVCNRCYIIPCLPLLYHILVTLVSVVESMLSWLRPVEVGWFPVTCEL